jgi:large subunit ribosomal protein L13
MIKTYSAKPSDVTRNWFVVDATGITLGRLASELATHLTGKHKSMYTAHIDCGDNVVVINAAKVAITGNKLLTKKYYRHSGYPGGIKESSMDDLMKKTPSRVIEHAVRGMLPKNRLTDERMKRLKVYPGEEHPHAPQQPKNLRIGK